LRAVGCEAEVSSSGELEAALGAGVPGRKCIYTGPAKNEFELASALAGRVQLFSAELLDDLRRIGKAATARGQVGRCLIRISTGPGARGGIQMNAGQWSRVGVGPDELLAALPAYLQVAGTQIVGAHYFPVSNAGHAEDLLTEFRASIESAVALQAAGLPLQLVDLGGGFPAPYAVQGVRRTDAALRGELTGLLDQFLPGWRPDEPAVAFESGRYLTAHSGTLISTVIEVRQRRDKIFLLLDSGINHPGGMSALGKMLRARGRSAGLHLGVGRSGADRRFTGRTVVYTGGCARCRTAPPGGASR
jgi:diaminopimelate decarboxylase